MRTRLIHPEFFSDPTLAGLSDLARFVFIGLWLVADRQGRLSDSVKMIDGLILPLDERSSAAALTELAGAGRITRYLSTEGLPVIEVCNFLKYQHIHPNEKPSRFPGPAGKNNGRHPVADRKQPHQIPGNTSGAARKRNRLNPGTSSSTSTSTSTSHARASRDRKTG